MKKLMMAVCVALLAGGTMFAQNQNQGPQGGNRGQAQQQPRQEEQQKPDPEKIAKGMASRLMLDDETSTKFVALYQEYLEALSECCGEKDEDKSEAKNEPKELTDSEIDEQMTARFEAQEKMLDVQKEYYDKFKKVLTMRQVMQLYDRPNGMRQPHMGGQPQGQPQGGHGQQGCAQGGQPQGQQGGQAPQGQMPQGQAPQGQMPQSQASN